MPAVNFALLWPEFLVTALAFIVFGADLMMKPKQRDSTAVIAAVGLVVILLFTVSYMWNRTGDLYGGMVHVDRYALFFKAFFLILGVVVIACSTQFVGKYLSHPGEYYGILLFSIVGMMLMAASGELLTAYISLELLSFSLYILASYARDNPKSNEAGMKYVLLGAFSSALLLYGISMVYGVASSTMFKDIAATLQKLLGKKDASIAEGVA